ncbi:MADF domain-containing protein, partial [Aphis craccivora]
MENLDYEKLIDVVRSHPAIWNMTDPDYSNKIKKLLY